MPKKLGWDKRAGQYKKDAGKQAGGGQHRFYLGDNEKKAEIAARRLEILWEAVEEWFARERDDQEPVWEDTTLAIGHAIAKGEFVCRLEVPGPIREMAAE